MDPSDTVSWHAAAVCDDPFGARQRRLRVNSQRDAEAVSSARHTEVVAKGCSHYARHRPRAASNRSR